MAPAYSQEQQEKLVERLNELHKKATCLTNTVAASPVGQKSHQAAMDVRLGPLAAPTSGHAPITGQLFVALKFVPENGPGRPSNRPGELQVIIKEARNIGGFASPPLASLAAVAAGNAATLIGSDPMTPAPPSGSLPNPFCKCYLLASNGRRLAKQKTSHLKRTANPRWDHKCTFGSVKLSSLSCQALEILLFNRDSILVSNNEFLGGIRLCSNGSQPEIGTDDIKGAEDSLCSERESRLWNQLLAKPNIWVYGELKLRLLRPLVARSPPSEQVSSGALRPQTNEILPMAVSG